MPTCELCGEPMPAGEEMFKYHGFSGPCPKPPLPEVEPPTARYQCIATGAIATVVGPHDPNTLFQPGAYRLVEEAADADRP